MNLQSYDNSDNNYYNLDSNTNDNILDTMNCNLPSFLFLSQNENKYFEKIDKNIDYNKSNLIKAIFLSKKNINDMNIKIVDNVYKLTNIKVKKQNIEIIQQGMVMIFDAYYCYLFNDINMEVNKLNDKLLEVFTKIILTNLNFNKKYKNDTETLYTENDLKPIYMNTSGTNVINNNRIFNLYN